MRRPKSIALQTLGLWGAPGPLGSSHSLLVSYNFGDIFVILLILSRLSKVERISLFQTIHNINIYNENCVCEIKTICIFF